MCAKMLVFNNFIFLFWAIFNFNIALSVSQSSDNVCTKLQGNIVPVYVPFDAEGNINPKIIKRYAQFLCESGIKEIEVNAPVGGGLSLSMKEFKTIIKAWVDAAKPLGIETYIHLGSFPLPDKIKLAKYASQVGSAGVITLPTLFIRPNTIEALVQMVSQVAQAAYPCSTIYLDAPEQTNVYLNMVTFFGEATTKIKGFGGLKTSLGTALQVQAVYNLSECQSLIAYGTFAIGSTYVYGLNESSAAPGNIFPTQVSQIRQLALDSKFSEAIKIQLRINEIIYKAVALVNQTSADGTSMTTGFPVLREMFRLVTNIDVGPPRSPSLAKIASSLRQKIIGVLRAYDVPVLGNNLS